MTECELDSKCCRVSFIQYKVHPIGVVTEPKYQMESKDNFRYRLVQFLGICFSHNFKGYCY